MVLEPPLPTPGSGILKPGQLERQPGLKGDLDEAAGPGPAVPLFDRLASRYGRDQIFKDVDSIKPGDDFHEKIADAVGASDVLLALIGEEWLTVTDEDGERRLDDPNDFVRLEIEGALERKIRIIPILVDRAKMPRSDELPDSLAGMVRRQALELSPKGFDFEIRRLFNVLDQALAEESEEREAEATPASEGKMKANQLDTAGIRIGGTQKYLMEDSATQDSQALPQEPDMAREKAIVEGAPVEQSPPRAVGGFGQQNEHLMKAARPQLNKMEAELNELRAKIGNGEELSQEEMLQYQDLMQRQTQLLMFLQDTFSSKPEKVKNWRQALGRIDPNR